MNKTDPKELRAQLEARRKEFENPRLQRMAAMLGRAIAWEAAKMVNDKRLVDATLANDHTPLLPVPILEEVRSHVHAKSEARVRRIRDILSGIAKIDPQFAPDKMPGTKADFFTLCQALDHRQFSIALTTFDDYIKGLCKFQQGARSSDYYKKFALQLGVNVGDISKPT